MANVKKNVSNVETKTVIAERTLQFDNNESRKAKQSLKDFFGDNDKEMKEKVISAVMSIATVAIGMLIALIESIILVGHGASANEAMIISLYSGFLLWVILAATVIIPAILDKLIK